MTIEVQVDGVGMLEFPDGTDKAVIRSTVQRVVAGRGSPGAAPAAEIPAPTMGNTFPSGEAALLAAGRRGDKMAAGAKQAGLGAKVIAEDFLGFDTKPDLQRMSQIEPEQAENDRLFRPVQKKFPMATAVGDALPAVGIPVGQTTALARILAPALGFGAMDAMEPGDAKERGKRGGLGFLSGLAGGTVGEIAARVVQPVRNVASGTQQRAAQEAAAKVNARLLPSQIADSPTLAGFEDMLAQSPGGRGPMADFMDAQRAAVTKHAASAIDDQAERLTKEDFAGAATKISDDYNRLKQGVTLPVTADVVDAVTAAEERLRKGSTQGKEQALAMLTELKDRLYATKALPGDEYSAWTTSIGTAARQSENRDVATALNGVKEAMNAAARGPKAAEWKAVDKRNASLETLIRPNVVNETTGQVNPRALAAVLKNDFGKSFMTGKLEGPLVDAAEFGRSVPQLREGSQTFGRTESDTLLGIAKALMKYPAAKALTSEAAGDYLAKGLMADPKASRLIAALIQRGSEPFVLGPANLGLAGYLAERQ